MSFGRVNEHSLRVVVLIVGFHIVELLDIVGLAIVVHIVASVESLPKARQRCVLLCAACREKNYCRCERKCDDM